MICTFEKPCYMETIISQLNPPAPMPVGTGETNTNKSTATAAAPIKRLSIIIPAYNEENTIGTVLDKINEVKLISNIEKEVIVVNDCSKDSTEQAIQEYVLNNTNFSISYFKYIK